MTEQPSVVYVLPDKMGGMMNIIANLLAYRGPDDLQYHAVLTHSVRSVDTRFAHRLAADTQTTVEFNLPTENLHTVMRRIARAVPPGPGVYVANDLLDLATASVHDFGRAVVQMLHGDADYYYDLAAKHDSVVHAFITYSRRMYERLCDRLPHRVDTIFHLPYGVPLSASAPRPITAGPLRLVFAGRLDRYKGIFDLPEIDRALAARGSPVEWCIAGAGPDGDELVKRWAFNPRVRFLGSLPNDQVLALYATQDVFVLPTHSEGFPIALVEAMAAGVVPVVSDLPSGVPEVVTSSQIGERPAVGDVAGFVDAIAALDRDRPRLTAMSAAGRASIVERFDIRDRAADYQALYARWRELYRPVAGRHHLQYGSRLDRPWLPNSLVRLVRSAVRAAR
jgi:glycosyltransferase involved in cell wall biosynthesis